MSDITVGEQATIIIILYWYSILFWYTCICTLVRLWMATPCHLHMLAV